MTQPNCSAPFDLGTYQTDDSAKGKHGAYVGQTFWVEDKDPSAAIGQKSRRTNRMKQVLCVRNNCAINLKPGQLVLFEASGGAVYFSEVDGYAAVTAGLHCAPVDDCIVAAGVPQYGVFYVVVNGPNNVITQQANMAADIAVGDQLISSGAGTTLESAGTTAGRVIPLDTADTDSVIRSSNVIGRALTGAITTATETTILASVNVRL